MTDSSLESKLNVAENTSSDSERAKLCRELLIQSVDQIYEKAGTEKPKKASLLELIDSPTVTSFINDSDTINSMHYVRIVGMNAEHGRSVRKKEAKPNMRKGSDLSKVRIITKTLVLISCKGCPCFQCTR